MKKRAMVLARFLSVFGVVNYNTPDLPGGSMGGGGNDSGGMGGSVDDDAGAVGNLDDSASGDATPPTGDVTPPTGDVVPTAGPNYDERFTALDSKITDLFSAIKNTNSDNDSSSKSAGDLSGLEHDDLVTMLAEDPAGFIGKVTAAVEQSVIAKVSRENAVNTYNSKVEAVVNDYADKNPDFEKMWDDGKIQGFMEKNPGHNAISSHMVLTMEQKITDAKKAGAEEAVRNFRTKTNNQVLNGGPGILPEQRDAALKNPEKFGGRSAVLAARAGIQ
jgi:hypothetical protein